MAWIIGDSFDFYSSAADTAGLWDSPGISWALTSGRFAGSRAYGGNISQNTGVCLQKVAGTNVATHHIVMAIKQLAAVGGTTIYNYITLLDGTTAQCSLAFRSDGALLLTSGGSTGPTLATFSDAFGSAWTALEIEITINDTVGAFHVRKNGNAVDDFAATSLNTRGGSTNNYANVLQIGTNASNFQNVLQAIDDFLWFSTSGAAPNTWVGDVRAVQQMPAADTAQKQFSPSSLSVNPPSLIAGFNATLAANTLMSGQILTLQTSGSIAAITVSNLNTYTGKFKLALYALSGSGPGALLSESAEQINASGSLTLPLITPIAGTSGQQFFAAILTDTALGYSGTWNGSSICYAAAQPYTSDFPSTFGVSSPNADKPPVISLTLLPANASCVNEAQEDGDTSYVSSNTVGANDLYTISPLATPPVSVVAVQTRGFVRKSDAGSRSAQVQLKSGATTATSTAISLSTSYQNVTRVDTVDPNTSAAWTGAGINAIEIGPVVAV